MINFKNRCVKGLSCYPEEPCKNGIKKIVSLQKIGFEFKNSLSKEEMRPVEAGGLKPCPWYIIEEDANYCFWKWQANPINRKELSQEMISILLGTSTACVYDCEKKAIERVKKKIKREEKRALLKGE